MKELPMPLHGRRLVFFQTDDEEMGLLLLLAGYVGYSI